MKIFRPRINNEVRFISVDTTQMMIGEKNGELGGGEGRGRGQPFLLPICTSFPHRFPRSACQLTADEACAAAAPLLDASLAGSRSRGALFQNSPVGAGASLQRCSRHRPVIRATRYLLRSGAARTVRRPHLAGRNNEARDSFDRNVSRDHG